MTTYRMEYLAQESAQSLRDKNTSKKHNKYFSYALKIFRNFSAKHFFFSLEI